MLENHAWLRRLSGLLACVALLLGVAPARAGNATYVGIVAASADAKHAAIFSLSDGFAHESPGMLVTVDELTRRDLVKPLVTAPCCTGFWEVLPYSKWKWTKAVPETRKLHAFSDVFNDKSDGKHARVVVATDTGIARLEILQDGRWYPVLAMPGGRPKVTGTLLFPGRYLIRTHHDDAVLSDWDEVRAFVEEDVRRVGERWLTARGRAGSATGALRELREQGARPFTQRPTRRRDADAWDYRRAKALDPVIEAWGVAAAYGPLTAQDLRDFVWLLAARNAPGQKLQALRLMHALRARDPRSAAALLADLKADPDVAELVPHLSADHDPMRGLPDPSVKTLTTAELQPLKDEEILWVHRVVRAMAGFRFNDPSVMAYVTTFGWYQPMPAKAWSKLQVDRFFLKDPDKAALWWPRDTLKAVLEIEQQRGLAKPAL